MRRHEAIRRTDKRYAGSGQSSPSYRDTTESVPALTGSSPDLDSLPQADVTNMRLEWPQGLTPPSTRKCPYNPSMGTKARRFWGSLVLVAAIAVTVLLGVLSGAEKQPSRSTSALLVILASSFQLVSVLLFSGIGRADPSLARAAVRRLIAMGLRASAARHLAESTFGSGNVTELRSGMGRLSVDLSWIEEGLIEAAEDWHEFHRDALKELGRGGQSV